MELQRLYVTLALEADDFKAGMASVTGIVAAAGIAAAAAITVVAVDGVKAARDMEEQMSGIAAIFSTTVDEIEPLGAIIKELGLNPNLKVNATEAADAIEMLGKNGLTMAEILEGAAESTVLLANSTGADFATAANIGTDAMALFNIEAEDMISAVDGITSVTVNSKFGINDYALALAQGGGVASAVGVTFEDFNATIAGISPLFKSGSDAGTSLKTMLMRLEPQTDKAAEAMMELGLMTDEGVSAFFDAEGNMRSMSEVAGLMQGAFGDLTEQQRLSTMQTIFGADAMRAAVGLMELGEEGFKSLSDTMGQTDALAAAATRMDNLSGAMEIFGGIVDTAKLSLGQALLPVIRIFVNWLIVIADKWMPKVEAAFSAFADALSGFVSNMSKGQGVMDSFIEAIREFIPPKLAAQMEDVRDVIADLIKKVEALLKPIWTAVDALVDWEDILIVVGIAIAATIIPIIISFISTIASVAAPILAIIAVVALLRKAWESDFMGIQGITESVWNTIQQVINAVLSVIGPAIETFTTNAAQSLSRFDTLLPALGQLWQALEPIVMFVLQVIGAQIVIWMTVVIGAFNGIANAVGPFIDTFIKLAADLIQILTGIANFITSFFDLIVGIFEGDTEKMRAAWEGMVDAVNEIAAGMVSFIIDSFTGGFETLLALVEGFASGVVDTLKAMDLKQIGSDLIQGLIDGINSKIEDAKAAVRNLTDWLARVLKFETESTSPSKQWGRIGADLVLGLAAGIRSGTAAAVDATEDLSVEVAAALVEKTFTALEKVMRILGPMIGAINSIMDSSLPNLSLFAEKMHDLRMMIHFIMQEFARMGWELTTGNINMAGLVAESVDKITAIVGSTIDAMRRLSETDFSSIVQGWHLSEQIGILGRILLALMKEFKKIGILMEEGVADSITAFADATMKIIGLVVPAIEAMAFLSAFDFSTLIPKPYHLRDQIVLLRKIIAAVMNEFTVVAIQIGDDFAGTIEAFAAAAVEVFALFVPAIEAIAFLSEVDFAQYIPKPYHLRDQLIMLRKIIAATMEQFGIAAEQMSTELTAQIREYVAAATDVFGLVELAIATITMIAEYEGVTDILPKLEKFRTDLLAVATVLIEAIGGLATDLETTIDVASDAAGKISAVLSVIKPAIDALAGIAEFVSIENARAKADAFSEDFTQLVLSVQRAIHNIWAIVGNMLPTIAEASADIVSIVGVIQPAIDALASIGEYVQIENARAKFDIFTEDFTQLVLSVQRGIHNIWAIIGNMLPIISAAAADIIAIVSVVQPAIDALIALSEYSYIEGIKVKTDLLLYQIQVIVTAIGNMFISPSIVTSAVEFSAAMITVLDQVRIAIDKMNELVNAGVPEGLTAILQSMQTVLRSAITPVYNIGLEIGKALIDGISAAITAGLAQIDAAMAGLMNGITVPTVPSGAAALAGPGQTGTGSGRTVVLEAGAFQVEINNGMDAEEFEFRMLEKLRELTE
jgi:TP901 family phage tail tape measure protein